MSLVNLTAEPYRQSWRHTAIVWLTAAVLLGGFYLIEHSNTQVSLLNAFSVSGDELFTRASEGDMGRRMALPMLAIFGMFLLLRKDGNTLQMKSHLSWLMLAYIGWCAMSVLWSTDPQVTVRRFSVLLFGSIGAIGVARLVTLKELCVITLAVSTLLVLNSLRVELSLGTFRPWAADYRFSGTLHPNQQAPYCATMALAAGFLATYARRGRTFIWGLCALAVLMLVLTKSRTICGSSLVGLAAFASVGTSGTKRITVLALALWIVSTAALAIYLTGWDIEQHVVNAVLIGRQDEAESLSGRIPLWMELIPHIGDNFLLGHGFMTFWNPQRIDAFYRSLGWAVPDGHSAYLDSLLDVGLIGASLSMATVFTGVLEARRHFMTIGQTGYGFLFALLLCRGLTAFLESALSTPTSFPAFVMLCGLASLGFCVSRQPVAVAVPLPQPQPQPQLLAVPRSFRRSDSRS